MATYVNDLRLKEIATGDEAGTWGTSTNTNLELIGEALGYGTQDCFSSDADATTTVADGATDPARAMYFKVTSSATLTAGRTLTIAPNTISRVMFIENATTGSQVITISQGTGGNVAIANGKTAVVYLDGAGSGAAVVDAMALVDPGVTDTLAEVLVAGNTSGGTGLTMSSGDDLTLTGASYNVVWDSSDSALEFGDNAKAVFGAGSDLSVYSDGSDGILEATANLTLDVAGDINLDADGADINLKDGGTRFGILYNSSSDFLIEASVQDKDIKFLGNDGGSGITALRLDMSEAGAATFNSTIALGDNKQIFFGDGSDGRISFDGTNTLNITASNGTATTLNLTANNFTIGGASALISGTANTSVIINEAGGDVDFRVESNSNTHALFVDAGNDRVGIDASAPAGKLEIAHDFAASTTDRLLYLNSSGGLAGGLASPVYGLYADIQGNNSATEIYGAYINAEPGTGDPTYGIYAQSSQTGSNKLGVAVYAKSEVSTAASGQNPAGADAVAGVYAKGSTTGTSFNSVVTALTAHNESTYGAVNYGAVIKSEVPTTPASTDSIPLTVFYGLSDMLTVHAQNAETVFNESSLDHDFRVESNGNANMLFVDGGNNQIGIGTNGTQATLHVFSSNSGATPSSAADDLFIEDSGNAGITIGSGTSSAGQIRFADSDSSGRGIVYYDHSGDLMALYTAGSERFRITATTATFNEDSNDQDFRVESNNQTHAIFVDAGNDTVNINRSSGPAALNVQSDSGADGIAVYGRSSDNISQFTMYNSGGTGLSQIQTRPQYLDIRSLADIPVIISPNASGKFYVYSGETVVNENSADHDFRVESNDVTNMLFIDAAANTVNINNTTDFGGKLNVNGGLNSKQAVFTSTNNRGLALSTASRGGQNDGVAIIDAQDTESTGGRFEIHTMGAERARFERDQIVFNDSSNDQDFRVESNGNTHAIFVNAGADGVGFGATASTVGSSTIEGMYYEIGGSLTVASNTETLQINRNNTGGNNRVNIGLYNNGTKRGEIGTYGAADGMFFYTGSTVDSLRLTAGEAVFNDGGADVNFRVESNNQSHMLFVDGGENNIGVRNASPLDPLHILLDEDNNANRLTGGNSADLAGGLKVENDNTAVDSFAGMFLRSNTYDVKLLASTGSASNEGEFMLLTDTSGGDMALSLYIDQGETVFNEDSRDQNFRVESDSNSNALVVDAASNYVSVGQNSVENPGNGNNNSGWSATTAGRMWASTAADHGFNRTSDGIVLSLRSGGTEEGTISISGSTCSYNGGHLSRWSQPTDNTRISGLLKGTVMTNLDQMASWPDKPNEQLNCMAVSSVEGDANVAGVFVNWDEREGHIADMNIAMTGDMIIRIAQGQTVQRGDLLMSAGDGTAKPQGDDIVRSKTIAKVTSTYVSVTYDDGTYCVPCVLMAC